MDGIGIIWTDFTFPKVFLALASSKFFGSGLQYVSRFRIEVFALQSIGFRSTGFHQIVGFLLVFKDQWTCGFSDLGALRVFPGFLDCTTVFQVFG
jgi:hypothetical protein